jgi:hypothetical protein
VALVNGTKYEVPAGFTSFNFKSGFKPGSTSDVQVAVMEIPKHFGAKEESTADRPHDVFTLEVTPPVLRQGKDLSVGNVAM